ncbi:MAG: hypothetical protein VW547_09765 [Alphaproteobacteria bacterium]
MTRCEVCQVRVGPCVEPDGTPMAQYHHQRVRAEAAARVGNYAHEGVRLRAAQKAGGR